MITGPPDLLRLDLRKGGSIGIGHERYTQSDYPEFQGPERLMTYSTACILQYFP